MLKGIVLAFAGFLLFLAIHVTLFRLKVPERRFTTMVRIALALGLVLIVIYQNTPPDLGFLPVAYTRAGWVVDLLNSILMFSFMFIGYCMFYFLVDRSFSGRIMIEVEAAPKPGLRPQDIAARYSIEMVLQRRLNEMLEIGRIVETDGRYRNTVKGQSAAAKFAFVKRFLQLGEGG